MIYILILVFILVHILFGLELGYTAQSAWWTHFTYWMQHGSILHLLLNVVSLFGVMKVLERFIRPVVVLTVAIVIAVFVSWLVNYNSVPVVGASGVVYALLGMYISIIVRGTVRFTSTFNMWLFFFSVFTFLIISFFKTNSAGLLHLFSLCAGFAYITFKKNI